MFSLRGLRCGRMKIASIYCYATRQRFLLCVFYSLFTLSIRLFVYALGLFAFVVDLFVYVFPFKPDTERYSCSVLRLVVGKFFPAKGSNGNPPTWNFLVKNFLSLLFSFFFFFCVCVSLAVFRLENGSERWEECSNKLITPCLTRFAHFSEFITRRLIAARNFFPPPPPPVKYYLCCACRAMFHGEALG